MLATSRHPFQLSPSASRAARVIRAVTRSAPVVLAVTAMAVAIVPAVGTARTVTGDGQPPVASQVFSPAEVALIDAGLRSSDPRTRWAAAEVAAGRAGFVALSDGALLRHHGILSADPNRVPGGALSSGRRATAHGKSISAGNSRARSVFIPMVVVELLRA